MCKLNWLWLHSAWGFRHSPMLQHVSLLHSSPRLGHVLYVKGPHSVFLHWWTRGCSHCLASVVNASINMVYKCPFKSTFPVCSVCISEWTRCNSIFHFLRNYQTVLAVFTACMLQGHRFKWPQRLGGEYKRTAWYVPRGSRLPSPAAPYLWECRSHVAGEGWCSSVCCLQQMIRAFSKPCMGNG